MAGWLGKGTMRRMKTDYDTTIFYACIRYESECLLFIICSHGFSRVKTPARRWCQEVFQTLAGRVGLGGPEGV